MYDTFEDIVWYPELQATGVLATGDLRVIPQVSHVETALATDSPEIPVVREGKAGQPPDFALKRRCRLSFRSIKKVERCTGPSCAGEYRRPMPVARLSAVCADGWRRLPGRGWWCALWTASSGKTVPRGVSAPAGSRVSRDVVTSSLMLEASLCARKSPG
jgi:hypothetical protein